MMETQKNVWLYSKYSKKISYEVLGKESRKIKRNGWISKDILEGTDEKRNSYQK
jgi:hypothetical protein